MRRYDEGVRVAVLAVVLCVACGKGDRDSDGRVTTHVVEPMKSEETSEPTPSPGPPSKCLDFDPAEVMSALSRIPYKSCSTTPTTGGSGSVNLTFDPTGVVSAVTLSGGPFPAAVTSCLLAAFRPARIPAFCPPAKTIGWKITL